MKYFEAIQRMEFYPFKLLLLLIKIFHDPAFFFLLSFGLLSKREVNLM